MAKRRPAAALHIDIGFHVSAVPEPSSFIILGSSILALAGMIRRRR
ncbi:MAG TPA: PEP-CTERM sorting domain-containing protein [Armatimonadota bacterium]|nr:PEP-CTERM sorting domain-containing protein [Armatimonadota bacterium]